MRLIAYGDQAAPITGSGYIELISTTEARFTLFGQTDSVGDAIQALNEAKACPYDQVKQLRLFAVDYKGVDWECRCTTPQVKGFPKIGFPIAGEIVSLNTIASGPLVSSVSSVEAVFCQELRLPMSRCLVTKTYLDDEEVMRGFRPGQEVVPVLDGEVTFSHDPADNSLSLHVATTQELPHPNLENWVCEPLRILLGRPVYPRLVARNLGDGTAQVWILPAPSSAPSGIASLFGKAPLSDGPAFWGMYSRLLALIASARDENGNPNLESHPLTRLYEEIAEASHGSRWVLCMTLASSVEALLRMIFQETERTKVENRLKELEVPAKQREAWRKIRHEVMHGHLTSPWGSESEDALIMELVGLVRWLTHHYLDQKVPKCP